MGRAKKGRHLTVQELADYFRPALSERREGEVEAHLAKCPECAKRAEETQIVLAVMSRWTAHAHSEALAAAADSRALARLGAQARGRWRERRAQAGAAQRGP